VNCKRKSRRRFFLLNVIEDSTDIFGISEGVWTPQTTPLGTPLHHIREAHQPDWVVDVRDSEKFRLTNVIPERIIFVSRGITVFWYFTSIDRPSDFSNLFLYVGHWNCWGRASRKWTTMGPLPVTREVRNLKQFSACTAFQGRTE